jgi:chemotaxis signal transduction protein
MSAPEMDSLVPSFVVFHVGTRRVALPQECVAELIASPMLFSFPHTTPLITGVALRRGRIVPVLDLGPGLLGAPSPTARFFLVADRRIANTSERCAIPVQGECELVAGIMLPPLRVEDDSISGCLDINGDLVDVLDLERTIANSARIKADAVSRAEAIS